MRFIRTLYGTTIKGRKGWNKLKREIVASFRHPNPVVLDHHKNRILYYTLGSGATEFLQYLGAKHVIQVDKRPLIRDVGGCNSWNKLYLTIKALEDHGEVLYTDFDVGVADNFDHRKVIRVLRKHKGLGRVMQLASVTYHRAKYFYRRHNKKVAWDTISPRKGFMGSLIYSTSPLMMQTCLDTYDELTALKKKMRSKKLIGDEIMMTFTIDRMFGPMTVRDLYENFEPEVIWNRTSHYHRLGVVKEYPVYTHV